MVTGVETSGLVLAILPLLVNQLDAYVQGLETIKSLRTRRYRRELDGHLARLGTQQAILLNTIEQLLEDVTDSDEDIQELIQNPTGPLWKNDHFQAKLSTRLGRDHDVYVKEMASLSDALQNLSQKLGLKQGQNLPVEPSKLESEIKRFKAIFLKSIYTDLFSKIDKANTILRILTQQSSHREEARRTRWRRRKPLSNHTKIRAHARSLHNAIVRGNCWNCPCKNNHIVNIRFQAPRADTDEDVHNARPRFRLALSSASNEASGKPLCIWQEVESEPVEIVERPASFVKPVSELQLAFRNPSATKVQFAIVNPTLQSLPWPVAHDTPTSSPITDMCSSLCRADLDLKHAKLLGFVSDETESRHRYDMYFMRRRVIDSQIRSLEDLLACAWTRSRNQTSRNSMIFNRKDRLYLAATLACGVLEFHGSWLKAQWASRDILFVDDKEEKKDFKLHPYISWRLLESSLEAHDDITNLSKTVSALIRNEVLFPLGIALVELSLNEPLASLRQPVDDDLVETVSNLKTATRLLQEVYTESGTRYGDVVDRCLSWPGPRGLEIENLEFQQSIFESVVLPLLQDLRDFEGRSGIR